MKDSGPRLKPANIHGVDAIYAITSQNKSSLRYQYLLQNQNASALAFNFIEQVDKDSTEAIEFTKVIETYAARAACYLSHLKVWKDILKSKLSAVIVVEDDVELEVEFKKKMEDIYQSMDYQWPEMMLIGHCYASFKDGNSTVRDVKSFACTHAYLITLQGVKKAIKYLEHDSLELKRPIDLALDQLNVKGKLNVKGVYQPLARQLPRSFVKGFTVTENGELPPQYLEHGAILSNEEYIKIRAR
jgi:GR25 family glycosyltransferase involved in LPS biosynthesis